MPETRYAKSGDVNIAYQVVGDGSRDIVFVPGWVSNVEVMWEDPGLARFLNRLASFSRLVTFDKRGTGLSDPVALDYLPSLEVRMDDLRAVMDAAGSESATIFGHSEGGALCILFAATYPDRADALILTGSYVKRIRSEDYPWAPSYEERMAAADDVERTWGDALDLEFYAPSRADDEAFAVWLSRFQRLSASPRAAAALHKMNSTIDVSSVVGSIRVPTLLLYRVDDADVMVEEGHYIASRSPVRNSSSSPERITSSGPVIHAPCSKRSRSSSPVSGYTPRQTGSSPRPYLPTSSTPPTWLRRSATGVGGTSCTATTKPREPSWSGGGVAR